MNENEKKQTIDVIEKHTGKRFMNKEEAERLRKAELEAIIKLETENWLKSNRLRGLFEIQEKG